MSREVPQRIFVDISESEATYARKVHALMILEPPPARSRLRRKGAFNRQFMERSARPTFRSDRSTRS